MDKGRFKENLILVIIGVLLFVGLTHFSVVVGGVGYLIGLIMPLIVGGAIAFILNVPMCFFEKHYDNLTKKSSSRFVKNIKSAVCMIITLVAFLLTLFIIANVIFPNIVESVKSIALIVQESYPAWLATLDGYGINTEFIREMLAELNPQKITEAIKNGGVFLLSTAGQAANSVFSAATNFLLGLFIALYILASKKKLARQARQLAYAYLKKSWADEVCEIASLTYRTFANFLSGQCLEAVILGCMFFVVLFIGGFPYAGTIAVLIGCCSLIPFIGAFIGLFFGALMIAVISLKKALIFVVVFLVVQQIEGQIVYPRVVGGSVGLPALWTLLAVIIGGNVSGIIGIIVFIPIFSVIYALLRRNVYSRLKEKNLEIK
ncbi:MAG: AI-2E family transporter [Firmicutes bacterium]|nr:AI-2E family transporter [Bacillota bacterium]